MHIVILAMYEHFTQVSNWAQNFVTHLNKYLSMRDTHYILMENDKCCALKPAK